MMSKKLLVAKADLEACERAIEAIISGKIDRKNMNQAEALFYLYQARNAALRSYMKALREA